jgi:hypothetical protein
LRKRRGEKGIFHASFGIRLDSTSNEPSFIVMKAMDDLASLQRTAAVHLQDASENFWQRGARRGSSSGCPTCARFREGVGGWRHNWTRARGDRRR